MPRSALKPHVITYLKDGDAYVAVTSECPKGFQGVLFVGRDADGERLFTADQLRSMTRVAKSAIPAEWLSRLGYEELSAPLTEPEPAILDITWFPFGDGKPVRRVKPPAWTRYAELAGVILVLVALLIKGR